MILLRLRRTSKGTTTLSVPSSQILTSLPPLLGTRTPWTFDRLRTAAQDVKAVTTSASTSSAVTRIEGDRQALFRTGACFYCKTPGHMKAQCPILAAKNTVNVTPVPSPLNLGHLLDKSSWKTWTFLLTFPLLLLRPLLPPLLFDDRSSQVSSGFCRQPRVNASSSAFVPVRKHVSFTPALYLYENLLVPPYTCYD